jgi:hypothetical protein
VRIRLIVLAALLTGSCSGPQVGEKITAAPQENRTGVATTTTTTLPAPRPSLGSASDVKAVDWPNTKLPAKFCDVEGLVEFRNANGSATSGKWGLVQFSSVYDQDRVVYGDIDGDGKNEAAVNVYCNNGSGLASGQLAFAWVVVAVRNGSLEVVGEISAKAPPVDGRPPLLSGPRFDKGSITVKESWYRQNDMTCCPTGEARTTWRLRDGALVADPTVQVS